MWIEAALLLDEAKQCGASLEYPGDVEIEVWETLRALNRARKKREIEEDQERRQNREGDRMEAELMRTLGRR